MQNGPPTNFRVTPFHHFKHKTLDNMIITFLLSDFMVMQSDILQVLYMECCDIKGCVPELLLNLDLTNDAKLN